jgi:ADP-ribose pyrophosphatase
MPLSKWKTLQRKTISTNPWWEYRLDTFELPHGESGEYHYVHTAGASMVLPLLDDGRIVMVRQYRYLCDRESLEFPCGGVKAGSDYLLTAKHELAEETGFEANELQFIGEFNPYNGVTDEMCRIYLARHLTPVSSQPDATEQFEQVLLTPSELDRRIESGEIWDGMTLAAWTLARTKLFPPFP